MLTLVFALAAINPFGGILVSIPLAMFKLDWPAWLAVAASIPLAYVQVLVVDLLWSQLVAWPTFTRAVERGRSKRLESVLAHRHARLWLGLVGIYFGPWLVASVARFGGHGPRYYGPPIVFGLTYASVLIAVVCLYAPSLLPS